MNALGAEDDPGQLRLALAQDLDELLLPPEQKSAACERLLALGGRRPETLRQYAWHLELYGPDRDDQAEALMAEAERADS